jgi:predicted RNA binding protein YcfA (HicA-like mRNA interferase family)
VKFREAVKAIESKGYVLNRVRGSHYIFAKNGREIIIPKHSRDVATFIIRNIQKAE